VSDDRTPEQRAADTAFEAAIQALRAAYDETEGMLMEWVVLTSQHIAEDDGSSSTAVSRWVAPGQPLHRSLGLLDYGATRLRAVIAGNADLERDDDG
jgi:hypothetical protein